MARFGGRIPLATQRKLAKEQCKRYNTMMFTSKSSNFCPLQATAEPKVPDAVGIMYPTNFTSSGQSSTSAGFDAQ